ncbi:NAD(+) diphosphatase [Lachnospiraceae bacterium 62-35]
MIQDIAPHIYYNQYQPLPPDPDSFLMICCGRNIFLKEAGGEITFLRFQEACSLIPDLSHACTYLFSIDGARFYLAPEGEYSLPDSFILQPAGFLRTAAPGYMAFAAITAIQLNSWYKSRRFCGVCGGPLRHHEQERMMYCDSCKTMEYPKISPAVIVAVTDGDRLLLTKYANRAITRYSLIAGFAEIGETIEETIHREVMEEVGLKVKNIRYYKSQPWSFTDTLLFGFYCQLDGPDKIRLDKNELAVAEWFDRKNVPGVDHDVSLTQEMMCRFRDGLE